MVQILEDNPWSNESDFEALKAKFQAIVKWPRKDGSVATHTKTEPLFPSHDSWTVRQKLDYWFDGEPGDLRQGPPDQPMICEED